MAQEKKRALSEVSALKDRALKAEAKAGSLASQAAANSNEDIISNLKNEREEALQKLSERDDALLQLSSAAVNSAEVERLKAEVRRHEERAARVASGARSEATIPHKQLLLTHLLRLLASFVLPYSSRLPNPP